MSKRTVYLAVASVVVLVLAGVAYGAANKIRWFTTYDPEPGSADGMAILNYASGANKTIVQIVVSNFTPGETYDLRITDGSQKWDTDDVFTTDQHGHGTLHWTFPFGDISTWDVELYVSDDVNYEPGELRAFGDNPATP